MLSSIKSGTIQGCLLLPLLFNIVLLEVPGSAIRQDKQKFSRLKKKLNLYIHKQYDSLLRKSDEIYKIPLLELKSEFSKVAGYKINIQISINNQKLNFKKREFYTNIKNYEIKKKA